MWDMSQPGRKDMSEFETYSILISVGQLGLIAWGIHSMREGNKGRDVLLETVREESAALREVSASLRAVTNGVGKLLERG